MNIVLIGFTSSGKTATGQCLARKLDQAHLDLDDCIESLFAAQTGRTMSVRDMFQQLGENAFEEWEVRTLHDLELRERFILSTGGRTPLTPIVQPVLKTLGAVIYLRTHPETVLKRMQSKGLPAYLTDNPTLANVERIWQERDAVYRSLADYCVDNTDLTVEQTADAVIRHVHSQQE